jgi:uncharacterized protein YcbK (DUF882 family)
MEEIEKGLHSKDRRGEGESEGSSTAAHHGSTGILDEMLHLAERALSLPEPPSSRWHRAGVTSRTERILDVGGGVLVLLLALGWTWSIVLAATGRSDAVGSPTAAAAITAALTSGDAPSAAYVTDAALNALSGELRGASGKLLAKIRPVGAPIGADSVAHGAELRVEQPTGGGSEVAPKAGIWKLAVAVGNVLKPITDMSLISIRPRSDKQNGRVGLYFIGNWPGETGRGVNAPKAAPASRYQPPSGFIEVTQANADTKVSEHFKLRDFLTHDQPNVWPKYLVLELRNVDKLELVLAELQKQGHDVRGVKVMSGFRTPQYNAGGGNTGGRAGLSRHMYGDAADIFIDSDGDGVMDDLNHDGKRTIADSRVVSAAVDRVEAAHPELVGGAGVYPAAAGHGPFIHIDTRGYRARWVGGPGGG